MKILYIALIHFQAVVSAFTLQGKVFRGSNFQIFVSKIIFTSTIGAFKFANLLMLPMSYMELIYSLIFLPLIFTYPLISLSPCKKARQRRRINIASLQRVRPFKARRVGLLCNFFGILKAFLWPDYALYSFIFEPFPGFSMGFCPMK